MAQNFKLKNAESSVILDDHVIEWLTTDEKLKQFDILNNLRLHSSGCAVFQKTTKKKDGHGFDTLTIYLHKLIAEHYLGDDKTRARRLVGVKNGNKLDCRIENLVYRTRSTASRLRKTSSNTGFTGVYREHNRFRAVISIDGKPVHIGMYNTAEEAAVAYNQVSREKFGSEGKVNKVKGWTEH